MGHRPSISVAITCWAVFFLVWQGEPCGAVRPVAGGGYVTDPAGVSWNGGPEPRSLGLTQGGWQPTIDGEPVPHDAGAKGPEFDLSQPNVVGPGVYTNVGAIGRRAKIFSYDAAESAGGLGIVENGMPSMAPGEYPFYGWLDMAFSEDNDGTYRVGVKYNNYMKVIKFNAVDHTVISEFRINTLGMQDYKRQMLSINCDSVCLPEHGCDTKVWGTGLVTDLWGLVAHNDSAAVVIRVLDRAWFQLYADNGTLLVNVDLNINGSPLSRIRTEPGKLRYGYSNTAYQRVNSYLPDPSRSSVLRNKVYYAYYHVSEGTCTHEGEQLVLIDPADWRPKYKYNHPTDVRPIWVGYPWAGSHSYARRLVKVTRTPAYSLLPGDIVGLTIVDWGTQPLVGSYSPVYPNKGGLEIMFPRTSQIAPTYWFPDGWTETLMGDWVEPDSWNGTVRPYTLIGSYSQNYCTEEAQGLCSFTAWLVVIDWQFNVPVLYRKRMTPFTTGNINVIATHLAYLANDRYLYAWTLRTVSTWPSRTFQNFMVVIDGLGNFLTPVEEVTGLFTWNHVTEFKSDANGNVYFVNSWTQYEADTPTGMPAGVPSFGRDGQDLPDTNRWFVVRIAGLASMVDGSGAVSPTASQTPSPTASIATTTPSPAPASPSQLAATSSPSPTATPTWSASPTTSPSPSTSRSPTPSLVTATPTPSPSPTATPTSSPSPTATPTWSASPTTSPSPSTSRSPTPSLVTATPTPSPSPTGTPTRSASPTTSLSPSVSRSPTPSLVTATPTPSPSTTATPSSTTSITASSTPSRSPHRLVTNSGGGGDDGGGAVAAGVAVPIAVLALAGIAAVVLYLVVRRWRFRLTPPPVAQRRGSQYAGGTPLHDHTPIPVRQHMNDMYSPHAEGFHGL